MADSHRALRTAALVAYRQFDQLREAEQVDVLVALMEVGLPEEASLANKTLFHLREQRRHQLTLRAILDGIVPTKTGAADAANAER